MICVKLFDIEVVVGNWKFFELIDKVFGMLLQYLDCIGKVEDYWVLVE